MILLDTHVLLWLVRGEERLGDHAREVVTSHHPVHYSAISTFEMIVKSMKGRLQIPADSTAVLEEVGLRQMPFVAEHAEALREFPELDRHDPFDRALLAQAFSEKLLFLTADRRLIALDREWILDASV